MVYAYPDGKEMIEEYDLKTHELLNRKIKKASHFKEAKWEFEVGELEDKGSSETIMKSNNAVSYVLLSLYLSERTLLRPFSGESGIYPIQKTHTFWRLILRNRR